MKLSTPLALLVAALIQATSAGAAPGYDESQWSGLHYREAGPWRGRELLNRFQETKLGLDKSSIPVDGQTAIARHGFRSNSASDRSIGRSFAEAEKRRPASGVAGLHGRSLEWGRT